MSRKIISLFFAAIATTFLLAASASAQDAKTKEVTVTGMGMSEEEATRDAMRKALEQGAGTYISSQSKMKDFAIVQDTVLARAAGFIVSKEILSKKTTDDNPPIHAVQIKAVVSLKGVEDVWGSVTTLLETMGRPKIMVCLSESIDGKTQEDSAVQAELENQLLKSGFVLVNKKQMDQVEQKEAAAAAAEGKTDKLMQLAKKYKAQIFITGSAEASKASTSEVNGISITRYGATAKVFCYRTDTGQSMSSKNFQAVGSAREANVAASYALGNLAKDVVVKGDEFEMTRHGLAYQITEDILQFWQDVLEGRGDAKIEVSGIEYADVEKLETALKAIKGIKSVPSPEFENNIASVTLQVDTPLKDLAKEIAKISNLKITSVSGNVIKAEWKKE